VGGGGKSVVSTWTSEKYEMNNKDCRQAYRTNDLPGKGKRAAIRGKDSIEEKPTKGGASGGPKLGMGRESEP